MDITAIFTALTGIKTATEIVKSIAETKSISEVQSKAIELQSVILSAQGSALNAQSEQYALVQKINELENKIALFNSWEKEKSRYELIDYGQGTFAYSVKESVRGSEPPHKICTTCYQNGKKSLLQFRNKIEGREFYFCYQCNSEHRLGTYVPQMPIVIRSARNRMEI